MKQADKIKELEARIIALEKAITALKKTTAELGKGISTSMRYHLTGGPRF